MHDIAPAIVAAIESTNRLILTAPTGSGKSTQVPQIILDQCALPGDIVVLQPRRLVTRMLARRVAAERNTEVGDIVGYQTRHERKVSASTRIRFVTEGLFNRQLLDNPTLQGTAVVILDEFHERNVDSDLALGFMRQIQATTRPDLRVIVMSATLDAAGLADALQCPSVEAQGRLFPVHIEHVGARGHDKTWDRAADAVARTLLSHDEGDVLVFMPGVYEIRRTIEACERRVGSGSSSVKFLPLHGRLTSREQDAAVAPASHRKVVVATNVAETSLTIEGVRHVVDSGLARVHRTDTARDIDVLLVEPISVASADQRAGRAGRLGPGTCIRLWSKAEHRSRPTHTDPELMRVDLASVVLRLKAQDVMDVRAFPWIDPPEETRVDLALALLTELGALDVAAGVMSPIGQRMARLPVHPRLSRFLVEASERGCLRRAIVWAALIHERDLVQAQDVARVRNLADDDGFASDLVARERMLDKGGPQSAARRDVERAVDQFRSVCRRLKMSEAGPNTYEDLVRSLLVAFRDHVAVRRDDTSRFCAMRDQKNVELDADSAVSLARVLIALDRRVVGHGTKRRTVISLATEVDPGWLRSAYPDAFTTTSELRWNGDVGRVDEVDETLFDGLPIECAHRAASPGPAATEVLVNVIVSGDRRLEHWNDKVETWIRRTRLVGGWYPERELITYDEDDQRIILHEIVGNATRWTEVRQKACLDAVCNALDWADQDFVERMAPTEITLTNGYRMKVAYPDNAPPRGRAKIQQLYDVTDTPRIAGGRVPLLIEILGPNFRPVQITDDLAGFWTTLYPEVKKELKRRYPKHEWR